LLACLLLLLPAAALAQQPCDGGGDPGGCEGGVASQSGGAGGGVPVGSTTPIHFFTGNKYLREVDLPALPGPLGLEIVRHYNSQDAARAGLTGRGWRLSYETDLKVEGRLIQITQADGRRIPFVQDRQDPSRFRHADPLRGEIRREGAGYAARYRWHWPDGRLLTFNGLGQLEEIRLPSGEFLRLTYGPAHELVSVTDPQGRSLILRWAGKGEAWRGITALSTPVGVFRYEHAQDGPRRGTLTQVRAPDGAVARDYHYEDARHPGHLTGITLKGTDAAGGPLLQRLATYAYDAQGRAIASRQGEATAGLRLIYVAEGHTRVENALGQTSDYRGEVLGGEWRLTEARGPGCAACPAADLRYEWDAQGRLIGRIELDAAGRPRTRTGFIRDGQGRVVELTRQVRQAARWSTPQRQARYAFEAEALQPSLIARPSVVAGREHTVRMRYDAAGQPIEVTEHGWRPALGTEGPQPLARTLRFAYGTVNAASLPVALDGPLPNGATARPADSDVTVREYDPQTRLLQAVTAPGGETTRVIERDAAKRPTVIRISDGMRLVETRLAYTYYGAPTRIEEHAWILRDGKIDADTQLVRLTRYAYDPQGRLVARTDPGELTSHYAYDAAGRLTHLIAPDGSRIVVTRDAEARPAAFARYASPEHLVQAGHARYDATGHLSELGDALGPVLHLAHAGDAMTLSDAFGVHTRNVFDGDGQLVARTEAADTPEAATTAIARDAHGHPVVLTAANGVVTRRLYDDFGQRVMEASPDRGVTLYVHDAAGRLAARIDETRHVTRYQHDAAGRLVALGEDGAPELVRFHYAGGALAELRASADGDPAHAVEVRRYRRDAFGRVVEESHWHALPEPAAAPPAGLMRTAARTAPPRLGLSYRSATAYDAAGRKIRETRPDGAVLDYRYGEDGQLAAISFDGEPILASRRATRYGGLERLVFGNGIERSLSRDARGRLTAIDERTEQPADHWLATAVDAVLPRTLARRVLSKLGLLAPHLLGSQRYRYDATGRIVAVDRRFEAERHSLALAYDRLGRLATVSEDGRSTRYTYDAAGNRLTEQRGADTARYHYRGNRLVAIDHPPSVPGLTRTAAPAPAPAAAAYVHHESGVPLALFTMLDRVSAGPPPALSIAYNSARRPVFLKDEAGRRRVHYAYDVQGRRIAKTVCAPTCRRTGYLYQDGRLTMETDAAGRITTHYVYADGQPIAKIEVERGSRTRHRIYALHTDHLGAPLAATDEQARLVWRAQLEPFGQARISAAVRPDDSPFTLNLRLPGQYFDAETGWHYNLYRDYDPATGRYLTPDPLGASPDRPGMNPYAYVANNPLGAVDPLGLYQSDVHYYMTYFLAIIAGMGADDARTMALATQYIDDNPDTRPVDDTNLLTLLASPLWNKDNLFQYHFVLWTTDPDGKAVFDTSQSLADPPGRSPQLQALLSYAGPGPCAEPSNRSLQFMGEFLHAFEDTFSHRRQDNTPFGVNNGFGHGFSGSEPDYTYNSDTSSVDMTDEIVVSKLWLGREQRTLEMEQQTYAQIVDYLQNMNYDKFPDRSGRQTDIDNPVVLQALNDFNAFRASEQSGDMAAKIAVLNQALIDLGYSEQLVWKPRDNPKPNPYGYDKDQAAANRIENLGGLSPADFPNAKLPSGTQ